MTESDLIPHKRSFTDWAMIVAVSAIVLSIGFCVLSNGLIFIIMGGETRTDPDPVTEPTAQYLFSQPLSTPSFINSINPPIGSTLKFGQDESICIRINADVLLPEVFVEDAPHQLVGASRLVLNGARMSFSEAETFLTFNFSIRNTYSICAELALKPGYHLFEVQIRTNSPFGSYDIGSVTSYTWAYRVE